jgi:hypothetical protein
VSELLVQVRGTESLAVLEYLYGEVEDITVSDLQDDCAGGERGLSVLLGPVQAD